MPTIIRMYKMNKIVEKLSNIQESLKVSKSQFNKFGGYNYRNCEDILEAVKPHLDGLVLTMNDDITVVSDRVYVKATVSVSDGQQAIEATAFAREPLTKKGMDESQITGAASSYARKYALNGLFAIDDAKDNDALISDAPLWSSSDKLKFDKFFDSGDSLGLFVMSRVMGEGFEPFYDSFPKGLITANKKRLSELIYEGNKQIDVIAVELDQLVENNDIAYQQNWGELTKDEKTIVWARLSKKTQETLRGNANV